MPKVPDFTDPAWHAARTDAELGRSILEGKGRSMPRMKDKFKTVDVRHMVAFVRGFRGGNQVVDDDEEPEPPAPAQPAVVARPPAARPRAEVPPTPSQDQQRIRAASQSFQRFCGSCHGTDGRGAAIRESLPSIPDFTAPTWHGRRRDAQLTVTILDGKGAEMPPFRDKISREQVRDLVAFIRSLNPSPRPADGGGDDDFKARFKRLEAEFEDLRRQSQALSARTPDTSASSPRKTP
jgi:mono/diheme cytochrome c family protein